MVKTSSKKQQGGGKVRKHLIRHAVNNDTTQKPSTLSIYLEKIPPLAKRQWNFLLRTCSTCDFIPVESDAGTGRANVSPIWKRCIHYIIVTVFGMIMSYQFWITIQRFAQGQLDLFTYMCACSVTILLAAGASTSGTTWTPQALCDLFNSWKSMENYMFTQTGRRITAFDEKATSIKVVLLAIVVHLAAVNASMFTLVGEVPTSVVATLKTTGWLELPDYLPPILWSLVFLPLELLTLWPPTYLAGVCSCSIALAVGTLKVFTDEARKTQVTNMNDWMRLYRLRRIMQVNYVIAQDWGSTPAIMILVCVSCGVILLLYVTIRPSDLPFLVYIWFPIVAALLMVVITWVCYDCVVMKRGVQDVDGTELLSWA